MFLGVNNNFLFKLSEQNILSLTLKLDIYSYPSNKFIKNNKYN